MPIRTKTKSYTDYLISCHSHYFSSNILENFTNINVIDFNIYTNSKWR